jgi:uncharacterized protein
MSKSSPDVIDKRTARRYILGRQGLFPGRRFAGTDGVQAAIRAAEAIQVDTISVIARNHDLALWSRVQDYHPDYLDAVLYQERQFFEYGHILFIYPLSEWAYWQAVMSRTSGWRDWVEAEFQHLVEHAREHITTRGAMASRDFQGREKIVGGFKFIKDVTRGLNYLWMSGEIVIHSRRGNDRVYELASRILPPALLEKSEIRLEEAEYFFAAKTLRDCGIATPAELARRATATLQRRVSPTQAKTWLQKMCADGSATPVQIGDDKEIRYYPASDRSYIAELADGKIPEVWQPLGTTTDDEVNFIAPLDNVIWDRARLLKIFDFEYVWEVYKPAPQRRWGYYTLPILWGDKFVARINSRLDRKTKQLHVLGFWLEDTAVGQDSGFLRALERGLAHFARFHEAKIVAEDGILPPALSLAAD